MTAGRHGLVGHLKQTANLRSTWVPAIDALDVGMGIPGLCNLVSSPCQFNHATCLVPIHQSCALVITPPKAENVIIVVTPIYGSVQPQGKNTQR
eukprot:1158487-Pelagomonas_calceolata.AAC.1